MKKKIFTVILLVILLIYGANDVAAYSPHYLPGGKNYLSDDNYEVASSTYACISSFMVKPYTQYTLTIPRYYAEIIDNGSTIYLYSDSNLQNIIDIDTNDMTYVDFDNSDWFYFTFSTMSETNYMRIDFNNLSGYFDEIGLENFQLEEGDSFTGYEEYIDGTIIDTSAPYFQSVSTVISYFDLPITVEEIKSSLTAYDEIDGDVTGSIVLLSDNYTSNNDTLGTYQVVFEVSDSSNNTSQITIDVEIVDLLSPVFSEIGVIEAVYPNVFSQADILAMLSASDNYDGDISSQILVESDGYTANSSVVGLYEMEFSVEDSSGNISYYTQEIAVSDNEGPIISGITSIVVSYDTILLLNSIKNNLSVIDNYDDPETLELVIESNTYSLNYNVLGSYEIVYSVTDSSGNKTYQTISIEVVDELGPAVYFNSAIIQTYTDTVMSLPDFIQLLTSANEVDGDEDYYVTVIYDSYTNNYDTPGIYHLSLKLETDQGDEINKNLQVKVIDRPIDYIDVSDDIEPVNESIISRYKQYFIGGASALMLVVSNLVWVLVLKKKK